MTHAELLKKISRDLKENSLNSEESVLSLLKSEDFIATYSYDDTKSEFDKINGILNRIISIINKPHILTDVVETVKRSQQAGLLSYDSFTSTLKDSKLWKDKNGVMTPEEVHTVEHVDSLSNYENRFIVTLVNMLEREIDRVLNSIEPFVESLEEHYKGVSTTYSAFSPIRDMRKHSYPYHAFSTSDDSDKKDIILQARRLKGKIRHIKETELYKVNRRGINTSIRPTNVLIHDPLYSSCYRYYVDHYAFEDKDDNCFYFNYVIMYMLKIVYEVGVLTNVPDITLDRSGRINLSNLEIRKKPFVMRGKSASSSLFLQVKLKDDNDEEYKSLTEIAIIPCLTRKEYSRIMKDNFDQVFIITSNNKCKRYRNVVEVAPYIEDSRERIRDLLNSLIMLFEADKSFYSNFCPNCASSDITRVDKISTCSDCQSRYVIVPLDKKDYLWIMNFRRN